MFDAQVYEMDIKRNSMKLIAAGENAQMLAED